MDYFLTSPRLGFRCWTQADLSLAMALWVDAGVMRYMGGAMSAEEAADRLALEMERQRTLGVQYWPIFFRDIEAFAGCAGLRPFHDEAGVFELGVHLAPTFWSRRLGEEAARAVMRYAFEELGAKALTAGHFPENVHSRALMERLGFQYTHEEPWGRHGVLHPYYRLPRSGSRPDALKHLR